MALVVESILISLGGVKARVPGQDLLNIVRSVRAQKLPHTFKELLVVTMVRASKGKHSLRVRIDAGAELFTTETPAMPFDGQGEDRPAHLVGLTFHNLVVPEPVILAFVVCNGDTGIELARTYLSIERGKDDGQKDIDLEHGSNFASA